MPCPDVHLPLLQGQTQPQLCNTLPNHGKQGQECTFCAWHCGLAGQSPHTPELSCISLITSMVPNCQQCAGETCDRTRVTSVSQAGASTSFGAHSIESSTSSQTSLHSVMLNQGVVALPGEGEAALQGVHRPCSPYPMSVSWGNLNMGPFISAINPVIK